MGSALAHLVRSDASSTDAQSKAAGFQTGDQKLTEQWPPDFSGLNQPGPGGFGPSAWPGSGYGAANPVQHHNVGGAMSEPASPRAYVLSARPPARMRPSEAYTAAARVIASGQRVSRRSLRSAGLHGSNADLGMLARLVRASPNSDGCGSSGVMLEGPAVSGLRKLCSLKPLPAMSGTRCGPPAEAGTRSPSEDVSDCNAVRCSAQYHAWPFRGSGRLCGTRALS